MSYEEAQEHYANEYDRKRDEQRGGDTAYVYPNDEKYTAVGERNEHHPGRRADLESIVKRGGG